MRIGHKMLQAAAFVTENPGCTKRDVVRDIAPDKLVMCHGYNIVDRAIRAGLIVAERLPSGRYSLTRPVGF